MAAGSTIMSPITSLALIVVKSGITSAVVSVFAVKTHHPQNSKKNLCQKPAQNKKKKQVRNCEKVAVSKAGENSVSPFVAFVALVVAAAVLVVVIVLVVLVVVACC